MSYFLLSFTCNYVVSVQRGFFFFLVLGIGCVILLWHSLGLQYNYFDHHNLLLDLALHVREHLHTNETFKAISLSSSQNVLLKNNLLKCY